MGNYVWLIIMIIMILVEISVPGLVSIWFAVGALAAYVSALCGAVTAVQVMVFVLVSLVLLFLTRPLAQKYINRRALKTNKDAIPGRKAVVTEEINNLAATGKVTFPGRRVPLRMRRSSPPERKSSWRRSKASNAS